VPRRPRGTDSWHRGPIWGALAGSSTYRRSPAIGEVSSINGGDHDTVGPAPGGRYGWIGGDYKNVAEGALSSVNGGEENKTSGEYSSILGSDSNTASGEGSSVSGGKENKAIGNYSSILGGKPHEAKLEFECIPSCP
jgi:hypothetical protein